MKQRSLSETFQTTTICSRTSFSAYFASNVAPCLQTGLPSGRIYRQLFAFLSHENWLTLLTVEPRLVSLAAWVSDFGFSTRPGNPAYDPLSPVHCSPFLSPQESSPSTNLPSCKSGFSLSFFPHFPSLSPPTTYFYHTVLKCRFFCGGALPCSHGKKEGEKEGEQVVQSTHTHLSCEIKCNFVDVWLT